MGICRRIFLLTLTVAMVLLAFHLYTPVTNEIAEPWKLQAFLAMCKVIGMMSTAGAYLGLGHPLAIKRALYEATAFTSLPADIKSQDLIFEGVKVRMYRPKSLSKAILPAVVYYHGGGWVAFSVDMYNRLCAQIAADAKIAVVSVEYRLAPEHVFPKGFDDCVTATVHLLRHGAKYRVDPKRVGIAGDSAGGMLAAGVANRLSFETTLPPIRFHALLYPAVQFFDMQTSSMMTHDEVSEGFLSRAICIQMWLLLYKGNVDDMGAVLANNHTSAVMKQSEYGSYVSRKILPEDFYADLPPPKFDFGNDTLSIEFEKVVLNPYFSPLMATDMAVLPPAYVMTAEFDILRDDGFFYVYRLKEAGVKVTHNHYDAGWHPFLAFLYLPLDYWLADEAVADLVDYIKTNI